MQYHSIELHKHQGQGYTIFAFFHDIKGKC